ncbi:MAG: hypothetical protein H6644_08410 [Caldilineaceae bacterium]|nr:hypothetical protein [Caldilineaceae bacterium]
MGDLGTHIINLAHYLIGDIVSGADAVTGEVMDDGHQRARVDDDAFVSTVESLPTAPSARWKPPASPPLAQELARA